MKTYKHKGISNNINTVGSMMLFLMFASCMMMIIGVAAGTYNRINSGFEQTFGTGASLRYITNKIKSAQSTALINEGSGLLLENGSYSDVIFFADGGLYERSVTEGVQITYTGGDKLFSVDDLKITEEDGLYRITVNINGKSEQVLVRKE